jgi:dGTPase
MDWADDITYAVHDLLDFFCAGQIPLDRLADADDASEKEVFFSEVFTRCKDLAPRRARLQEIFQEVLEFSPLDRRYVGTLKQRTGIWQFTTVLISRYVDAIRLLPPTKDTESVVQIESYAQDEIRMLKELTWHYVILNNELATVNTDSAKQYVPCSRPCSRQLRTTRLGIFFRLPIRRRAVRGAKRSSSKEAHCRKLCCEHDRTRAREDLRRLNGKIVVVDGFDSNYEPAPPLTVCSCLKILKPWTPAHRSHSRKRCQ